MSNLTINRNIELRSGIEWIKASFIILRERPVQFVVLGLFSTFISLIPLLGAFMQPLFTARFASLAASVERGDAVHFSTIFDDFFANKIIFRLAFLNFCLNTFLFILQYLVNSSLKAKGADLSTYSTNISLVFFIPIILLQLALWLSPIICLYNQDIQPLHAMWLSIKACSFNVVTLLLYSLIAIFFTLLAVLPFGLGLLIWLPMLNIITYFIYKSMYIK